MQKDLEEIKTMLNSKFVTAEAFAPVKALVYGLVGLILTSVVIALIALVVTKP
jgi:ABC-type phosphate transport system permease subunit